jgi:hypothetical protein
MNEQKQMENGFYMHYKNKIYRLIKFVSVDTSIDKNQTIIPRSHLVIYQPQYKTEGFPQYLLWARPREMFFENIDAINPRFRYMGSSVSELKSNLKNIKLSAKLQLKDASMLEESSIPDLVFGRYAILGFALHSETLETQILYKRDGSDILYALPQSDFFRSTGLLISPLLEKYLDEINKAKKLL